MAMYKIELHTSDDQLEKLDFLFQSNAEVIGGSDIRSFEMNRLAQQGANAELIKNSHESPANMRIEIFIADPPSSLLQQLAASGAARNLRVNRCRTLDLTKLNPAAGVAAEADQPEEKATPVDFPARCTIEPGSTGEHRLKVEAASGRFFLEKIFSVLGSYHLPVQSGRKFRQGATDFAILTIARTNSALISDIVAELNHTLSGETISACHGSPVQASHITVTNLTLSRQDSGGLSTLRISATSAAAPFRHKIHTLFCDFDCDVAIARMLTRGDGIEDTYHLRIPPTGIGTSALLHSLRLHLQGDDHAEN